MQDVTTRHDNGLLRDLLIWDLVSRFILDRQTIIVVYEEVERQEWDAT